MSHPADHSDPDMDDLERFLEAARDQRDAAQAQVASLRAELARHARAFGSVESALSYAGARPLDETVKAVMDMRAELARVTKEAESRRPAIGVPLLDSAPCTTVKTADLDALVARAAELEANNARMREALESAADDGHREMCVTMRLYRGCTCHQAATLKALGWECSGCDGEGAIAAVEGHGRHDCSVCDASGRKALGREL